MIRVLLVDDHPVVRAGYRRLLEQAGDIGVVAEAATAELGYSAWVAEPPDVCVSDLSLPGMGGLELLRKIITRDAGARVLIFSMHDTAQLVRRAFDAGARGFVSKHAPPDNLVAAVRAAADPHGQRYLSDDLPRDWLAAGPCDTGAESTRLDTLSQREFEIFRLLAEGRTPADCARLLNLSAKTIANHQTFIKEKLAVTTSAALAHLALRHHIIEPHLR